MSEDNMKTTLFLSILLINIFANLNAQSNKNQIAVLNLEAVGISEMESVTLSDRLRSELIKHDVFTVIERNAMETILEEQGFQQSGCTSDECAVEIGKLLNINQICAGSVGKVGSLYTISLRLIDVQSGEILLTANEDCRCPVEEVLTGSMKKIAEKLVESINDGSSGRLGLVKQKSNGKAFLRSLVFPGWGQVYQQKKVQKWLYPVLFFGSLGVCYYTIQEYNIVVDEYEHIRQEYIQAYTLSNINRYKGEMNIAYDDLESKEQLRNTMLAITGSIYLWNLLDIFLLPPRYQGKVQISSSGRGVNLTAAFPLGF
jgi:TolB-like protein